MKSATQIESIVSARRALQKNLKELRKERRLSCRVVSWGCGLHGDAYRKYERGELTPKLQALVNIASYYDVTIDYLLGRDEKRNR